MIISTLPMRDAEPIAYTTEHDSMTPAQIWAAWKAGKIAVFHMWEYQNRHGGYFTSDGDYIRKGAE